MTRFLEDALFERPGPSSQAVRFAGASLTGEALCARARALAGWLQARGVGPGDLVGVYMHKSLDLPAVVFGILASGAGYVPIDPMAPMARAKHIAQACDLSVIIVGRTLARHGPALHMALPDTTLLIDAPGATFDLETAFLHPAVGPVTQRSPANIAYILFTSGSTGAPKGIVHTHASALAYADACAEHYDFGPDDRMAALTPLHFDMSTFDLFAGLSRGATLVLVPESVAMLPASLTALLEAEQITVLYAVPYALTQMVQAGGVTARNLSALRLIAHAGDVMPPQMANAVRRALPDVRLSNSYGPTELNQVTAYEYGADPVPEGHALPIGQPLPNAHIVIDGPTGELLVSTPAMMQCYWRDTVKTAEVLSQRAGDDGVWRTYYHTGDIATQDKEGVLHFHGRLDRQIKLRGYRIELDEIELAMAHAAGVLAAAAVLSGDKGSIMGFVVPKPGATVSPAAVIAVLKEKLPAYAVPRAITVLSAFPQTSTGKVDRKKLVHHV